MAALVAALKLVVVSKELAPPRKAAKLTTRWRPCVAALPGQVCIASYKAKDKGANIRTGSHAARAGET